MSVNKALRVTGVPGHHHGWTHGQVADAFNQARAFRTSAGTPRTVHDDELADALGTTRQATNSALVRSGVYRQMRRQNQRTLRNTIWLKHSVEGKSEHHIARELGMPRSTVHFHIAAMKNVSKRVDKDKVRRDAATAATGYAGILGASAMRHEALQRAYGYEPRPRFLHERKFLHTAKGRKLYLGGAALATAATVPAAYGTWGLLHPKQVAKIAPRIVYHGTGPKAARKIMRGGFKNSANSRHGLNAVYTAAKPGEARIHSMYASKIKENRGYRHGRVIQAMAVGPARTGYQDDHLAYDASQLIPVAVRGQKHHRMPDWPDVETASWDTVKKRDKQPRFIRDAEAGTKDAFRERTTALHEQVPTKYRVATHAVNAGVGATAGGLTGLVLRRKTKIPKHLQAGIMASAGIAAGTGSNVVTSRVLQRKTHGQYEVTPSGVRRRRTKPIRPTRSATVIEARPGRANTHPAYLREQLVPSSDVGKGLPSGAKPGLNAYTDARIAAHRAGRAFAHREAMGDWPSPSSRSRFYNQAGRARLTSRKLLADAPRPGQELKRPFDPAASHNRRQRLAARDSWVRSAQMVAKYYGEDMTNSQKRTRVIAAGQVPVIGDWTAAAQAARMAPPGQQHTAFGSTLAGSYGGSAVGSLAGAHAATSLARKSPKFAAGAEWASDKVDQAAAAGRKAFGFAPKAGPGFAERFATHARTPGLVRRAMKPVMEHPKVAAAGMLLGGAVGGPAGQMLGYDSALHREHTRKIDNPTARHGVGKRAAYDTGMTRAEEMKQLKRRHRAAVMGATGAGLGLTSLGMLGAAAAPGVSPARRARLVSTATKTSIAAGGVGGVNGLEAARVANKDIKARRHAIELEETSKGFRMPHIGPPGFRRAKTYRASTFRQTRTSTGVLMPTRVRANLG